MDAMGEGLGIISINPLGSLCVFCEDPSFYYSNCLFDLVVCGIYFVPATLLFYIHVKNYCLGKTTYERLAKGLKNKVRTELDPETIYDD